MVRRYPRAFAPTARTPWATSKIWGAQTLSGDALSGRYRNVFSGHRLDARQSLPLAEVFADLRFAVLVRVN